MAATQPQKKSLGTKIKDAREAAGMTQLELAHAIGMQSSEAGSYISRIEAGKIRPLVDTLFRLAKALDTPMETLLENAK